MHITRFISIWLLFLVLFFGPGIVFANCNSTTECSQQIADLEKKIGDAQKQSQTLSSAIAYLNLKQTLAQRQIDATQFQIQLLQRDIESLGGKITLLEGSLNTLTASLLRNVSTSYKHRSIDDVSTLLSSRSFTDVISTYKYLMIVQRYRQDMLLKTTQTKFEYDQEKTTKEKKQDEISQLKKQYERQKQDLAQQEKAKQELLSQTKSSEATYQKLLTEARSSLGSLSRYADSVGVSLLPHQEQSDSWGKYFNQRDSNWGNLLINGDTSDCRGGPCTLARVGCLVTSYSMVVSHFAGSVNPSDIAVNSSNFSVNTADFRNPGPSANGHSPTRVDNPSIQQLRDLIRSGAVVIAGLSRNGGPYPVRYSDHWVVLRSVDGDSFRINDPVFPGAMNVLLSDHYSGWTIIQARVYR